MPKAYRGQMSQFARVSQSVPKYFTWLQNERAGTSESRAVLTRNCQQSPRGTHPCLVIAWLQLKAMLILQSCIRPNETIFISIGSLLDFRMWESCWTMPLIGGFSQRFTVPPPPFHYGTAPYLVSPSSVLKTSTLRSHPNLFAYSLINMGDTHSLIISVKSSFTNARLHQRGSKLDPRSDLRSTHRTVAPFEFRAGLEIETKFISNCRKWWFEISIRDQTKINESEIQILEILLAQHFYIGTKIKLDPGSELGSFDLGSGKMLVQPDIRHKLPRKELETQNG
ncbi:hypothetical protein PR048_010094 [Dryococelus australis]|uniref:Uncharacterized protein n=1 Tax=Dryococelus australis TaxID=614101 RepID=A0ABQ9I1R7_9NEOP|nr:hypothetical protein PR048_010094 [Dryococelus australis]